MPGNTVLAADSLDFENEKLLIERAGCLVIHNIRQQPRALRHTPRWERWGQDIEGYYLYRRALDCERLGEKGAALDGYDQALRHEPGSFLISIRKAALLEGMGKFKEASEAYRTCYELWPEHIESGYRLAASYANNKDVDASKKVLDSINNRLKRRILWGEWGKTWWLTRWNVGERHYWRSWSRRRPSIFGPTHRYQLCMAVQVAAQVRGISRILLSERNRAKAQAELDRLVGEMAKLTTRGTIFTRLTRRTPRRIPAYIRLFHPERLIREKLTFNQLMRGILTLSRWRGGRHLNHSGKWHDKKDDTDLVMRSLAPSQIPRRFRPRRRIGWLAHYNAACFYSLALQLRASFLPSGYPIEEWKIDCARAAIRELGHVRRDPLNKLEPEWYRSDPELQPLTDRMKGTRWAELVGL